MVTQALIWIMAGICLIFLLMRRRKRKAVR
jgi:hypothetical protein